MSKPRVRPFPWRSLEAISRDEVSALRDTKRWAAGLVRLDRLASSLAELLATDVEILVTRSRRYERPGDDGSGRPLAGGVAVRVARADTPDVPRSGIIEADGALAMNAVARALKRRPPALTPVAPPVAPDVAGSFAAVIVAAARRAHAGVALRVLDAGPVAAVEAALDGEFLAVSLTVIVEHDAFAARVVVSRDAVMSAAPPAWDVRALAALGATPLALPIVACAGYASVSEVAALRTGDAFVPARTRSWPLTRTAGGALAGLVSVAPAGSALGLPAELGEGGSLVLRGGVEAILPAEARMDDSGDEAMAAAIGEVPVLVRVEIGEAVMAARDWAALGRGDIVPLARRVGEAVVLRVDGVAVARGELVDVEGEVAVRIVEKLKSTAAP